MTRPAYDLLPAVHRIRDAELEYPLRALLEVVEEELARLRADVDGLYDDWFIETCAEWVVPYIGALLSVPPLHPAPGTGGGRALVANTIGYRRRTGTAGVLEQVARDVTGWPARAVEYFALLVTTQHLDHVRPEQARTADLRDAGGLAAVGTPFDDVARSADVRHIDRGLGRYNLPDVGVHLWRLAAYPVKGGYARAVGDAELGHWTFDPAGRDRRLFRRPTPVDTDARVGPENVPAPLPRRVLLPAKGGSPAPALTGPDPVLAVRLDGRPVAPARLICADLRDWTRPRAVDAVAVDPVLGRLTLPEGGARPSYVAVDYSYGFPGDVGAGPHDRRDGLAAAVGDEPRIDWWVAVTQDAAVDAVPGRRVRSVAAALQLWESRTDLHPGQVGVIAITDSATYTEELDVVVPPGDRLVIVAAAEPSPDAVPEMGTLAAVGVVPHLVGDITVSSGSDEPETSAELVLDGLSVEGDIRVGPGELTELVVADCTLVHDGGAPGGWVRAGADRHLAVRLLRSVAAGVCLDEAETLVVADSILHGGGRADAVAVDAASARTDVTACTVLGTTAVRILTASNTIFRDRVDVARRQEGCVRFSYLPYASRAPRRYHCQPTSATSTVVPVFTDVIPVDPAFVQLAATCPEEISGGADDQGEMGAHHALQQPGRMANLTAQLDRYLRFGLEAGFFFAT